VCAGASVCRPRDSSATLPVPATEFALSPPFRSLPVLVAFGVGAACAAPRPAPPVMAPIALSLEDGPAIAPLATFDSAWHIIARTHWDTTYNGVDWAALRDSLRPRAEAAASQRELRGVLRALVGSLRQSHFDIIPGEIEGVATGDGTGQAPAAPRTGQVGLTTRWQDGRVLVTHVEPGSPAAAAGIRPGWLLDAIDGEALAESLAALPTTLDPRRVTLSAYRLAEGGLRGAPGTAVQIRVTDGAGASVTHDLTRTALGGTPVRYGNLPPQLASLSWERREIDGKRVGVIRFDIWMPVLAREFDLAVDSLRDSDGLVLDIRGNFGGVAGMAMGIGGHLVDSAVPVGVMLTRAQTVRFTMNPRRVSTANERVSPFAGPVAVVVDGLSVSTSEIFAGGLQDLGRVRVFGEQTAGQALPAMAERLPNGDILYHAIADFRGPSGRAMEGDGVRPDELVRPERDALLRGEDPALDRAVSWAASAPPPTGGTWRPVTP
jgi:carboxyl-terminal processing protease